MTRNHLCGWVSQSQERFRVSSSEHEDTAEGSVATFEQPISGLEQATGLRPVQPDIWCDDCLCIHEDSQCVRDPRASGSERYGRRVAFELPDGTHKVHGVLLAPVDGRWRARVLTYPRTLWTYPGRRITLKFIAEAPQVAERMAIEFIRKHCVECGHQPLEDDAAITVEPIDHEERVGATKRGEARKPTEISIEFGVKSPLVQGKTADLSERGLFIVTDEIYQPKTILRIRLQIDSCRMPLRGVVMWTRTRATDGRPKGLGIQLIGPPALYGHFVRRLP